jgi:integrase
MTSNKKLFGIKELSNYTGFPEWTIRKLVQERRVPVTRVNRRIYFDINKIDLWLDRSTVDAIEAGEVKYARKKEYRNDELKGRTSVDGDLKSQLKSSDMRTRKESWKRWDKGIYTRDNTVYISYQAYGRRIKEPLGPISSVSRNIARQARSVRIAEIAQGKFNIEDVKRSPALSAFCDDYIEYVKSHNKSWRRSKDIISHLTRFFGGSTKLCNIGKEQVEKYKTHRLGKVKPATINRELACLKHIFNMAIKWGKTSENPVKGIRLFKEEEPKEMVLSIEEEERLLNASSQYLRDVIVGALNTGMRLNELTQLKWNDVDIDNRIIFVRNSKSKKPRRIPTNNVVQNLLIYLSNTNSYQEYVFLNSNREPIKSLRTSFEKAKRKAKLNKLRFHDLRHTAATRMAMTGRLDVVRKILGHSSINVTMRYMHPNEQDERNVLESLDRKCPDFVPQGERDASSEKLKELEFTEIINKN